MGYINYKVMGKWGEGTMKEEKFLCDEEILKWLTEKNLSGIIKQ